MPLTPNLPKNFVLNIRDQVSRFLPEVSLTEFRPMPSAYYYAPRNRYHADSLIRWLRSLAKLDEVLMGITKADMCSLKGKNPYYGIMGLGFQGGNAAVASPIRLKNKLAFWKIVIHVLGHTAGLPHCPVKTCFMRAANGGNHAAEENGFCSSCKIFLQKKKAGRYNGLKKRI